MIKENRSLSLIEVSEIAPHIFRNDRLLDCKVGTIWKNSHLNINQNENTLLDSPQIQITNNKLLNEKKKNQKNFFVFYYFSFKIKK
jgi:hypothetical protein